MLSPNEGPAQIEESCSHGMPYCAASSSMGAVVLGISRNRILRKSSARTASVKQSFQGIARTDGCVGVTIPSCVVLDSKLTRTARPLPYCNSQSILLLHVFTCQNRRSAQREARVNSYDSCSKSSGRTSYRRSHSGATCPAGEHSAAYGTRCKRKSRSSSNLCGSQSTPSHYAECGTRCD